MESKTYISNTVDDLHIIAEKLFEKYPEAKIFAFLGEMGAGKTTFIKEIANYFGVEDNVSSPTFSLVNEYLTADSKTIYHFDLYRVKHDEELLDIGFDDYVYSGNICLIEWADDFLNLLPENFVQVFIEEKDNIRYFKF